MTKILILCILLVVALLNITVIAKPISVVSFKQTPLSGAVVRVTKLDGTSYIASLDYEGKLVVKEVPLGVVILELIEWKGVPINVTYVVTPHNSTITCTKIGALLVYVKGSRGQGLGSASVVITWNGKVIEQGFTSSDGSYSTELPEGKYVLKASYGGKEAIIEIKVVGNELVKVDVTLDVFLTIFGLTLGLYEFIGASLAVILLIIALFVVMYELRQFMIKRRLRRLIK